MRWESAIILSNIELGPGHWLLALKVEQPLPAIRAGQFMMLRCQPADQHSLLRPFSILSADALAGTVSIYYKHLGRLSRELSEARPGMRLDCLYPLGNGFPWLEEWRNVALVGGGVGIAPLLCLAQQLEPHGPTMQIQGFFGAASKADLVLQLMEDYSFPVHLATLDGSAGLRGTVVDLFQPAAQTFDAVYTCGPNRMMEALVPAIPAGIPAFASLEEHMACGVGACYGCTARVLEGGAEQNLRVCQSGPVFELRNVVFK